MMAWFRREPSVPQALYDAAVVRADRAEGQLHQLQQEFAELARMSVKTALDMKRAEHSIPGIDFDVSSLDAMGGLGPQTQLSIEEFAQGDVEMRKYLVGRAHLELASLKAFTSDEDELDTQLAIRIRNGDTV